MSTNTSTPIEDPQVEEHWRPMAVRAGLCLFFGVAAWLTHERYPPLSTAGYMLAFTLSLDDLVIASFTSGPGATTLPMVIFSSVRLGLSPQINALASL